jgi:hypothetical protein
MDRESFKNIFLGVVADAIAGAQQLSDRPLLPKFKIELHGGGIGGRVVTLDDALERMFVSESLYFKIIDVGLKKVERDRCIIFVRISDHSPVSFQETWNTPKGNGPFKVILPTEVNFVD